jgi:hypothetical protein
MHAASRGPLGLNADQRNRFVSCRFASTCWWSIPQEMLKSELTVASRERQLARLAPIRPMNGVQPFRQARRCRCGTDERAID